MGPAADLTLYRIAQEALTNARKHAGPLAEVDLTLRAVDDGVELEVTDSGRGAPTRAPGTGRGLQGMHERAGAVGGRLTAKPKSRGGWLVRVWVPEGTSR